MKQGEGGDDDSLADASISPACDLWARRGFGESRLFFRIGAGGLGGGISPLDLQIGTMAKDGLVARAAK